MPDASPSSLRLVERGDPVPSLAQLRSTDAGANQRAWADAYPLLHREGHRIAHFALSGAEWMAEREDLVLTALGQLVQGIVENRENSYNGLGSWDDVVGMMRTIVRRRAADFLRQRGRRPLDYVGELPEPAAASPLDDLPFTPAELWSAVEELDPPLPDLFKDRFASGWNTTEIAERRGMNVNTLLTHFAKGFRALKARLEMLSGEKGGRS